MQKLDKQALSDFDAKCVEISRNPGSDCTFELECTVRRLEEELGMCSYNFSLPLTSWLMISEIFASGIATIPEPDLTENQRIAKKDIPAVQREIRMVQAFRENHQWRLSVDEETGNIRIKERNEVVFDARGCYCVMTEDQASEYYRTARRV